MCANKQLIFEKFVQVHPAYVLPGFLVNSGISKNSDYSLLLGTKAGFFFLPIPQELSDFLIETAFFSCILLSNLTRHFEYSQNSKLQLYYSTKEDYKKYLMNKIKFYLHSLNLSLKQKCLDCSSMLSL